MAMNLRRSSIMSSISALKVALVSRKKESRAIIIALLSFVFCFSSLIINIKADFNIDAYNINAFAFFDSMHINYKSTLNGIQYMSNKDPVTGNTYYGSLSQTVWTYEEGSKYNFVVAYYQISGGFIQDNSSNVNKTTLGSTNNGYYIFEFYSTTGNAESFRCSFEGLCNAVPIWAGEKANLPDDLSIMFTGKSKLDVLNNIYSLQSSMYSRMNVTNDKLDINNSRLNTVNNNLSDIKSYFESNTTITNNNVTNNNNAKSEFDSNASSLATFESNQGTNLDTNLQALDISSDSGLLVNSSFVKSALWVNSMFDRLIVGSPFELVLVFCLSIGIAFAMIGKVH